MPDLLPSSLPRPNPALAPLAELEPAELAQLAIWDVWSDQAFQAAESARVDEFEAGGRTALTDDGEVPGAALRCSGLASLDKLEPGQLATLWDWGVWTPDFDGHPIQA
jgi:hypothetical protein